MKLKFVICGLEHSGTTLVSDIFRQIENIDSGFECGVLLGQAPKDFPNIQPFYKNMPGGWDISEDALREVCNTDSFCEFYSNLYQESGFFNPDVSHIFDKTPRYFRDLFNCQEKIGVPFIATYKDPRSIVYSDFKRSGKPKNFEKWYEHYKVPKLRYLSNTYNNYLMCCSNRHPRASEVLCVALEDICLDTRSSLEKMFSHVDLEFNISYLLLKNLRYAHTRLPQISSRIPFEYLDSLSPSQIRTIERDFSSLDKWFYQ